MLRLDTTNLRLIELLQRDARISTTELARLVSRSESAVRERVASLEAAGVLVGYRALVDPEPLGYRTHGLLRASCDFRQLPEITKHLEAVPGILSVRLTTGPKPLRLEVRTESPARLEQLMERRIASLELEGLEVALVVRELVPPRPLPMPTSLGINTNGRRVLPPRRHVVDVARHHTPPVHAFDLETPFEAAPSDGMTRAEKDSP